MPLTQVQGGMLAGSTNTTTTIQSNGTTAITIDSSQRVGINKSSPGTILNIGFTGPDAVNTFRIEGSNGSSERYAFDIQADGANTATKFMIGSGGGSPTERMRIDSSGNVGIGTSSPGARLHVSAGNILCNGATGSGFKLNITSDSGADREMLLAGVAGVSNGLQVNFINSTSVIAYRFNSILTTGAGANAHLDAGDGNRLYRSTSSLRYKKDIENIEQTKSDAVLNLRPVWYRSKIDDDKKEWSWYGLIAEEVAEIEPRLVHWTYLDSDYDIAVEENGNIKKTLKEGAKLVPDGVQYERVAVLLLDVVKRQEKAIQEQQAMIEELKAKVTALEAK